MRLTRFMREEAERKPAPAAQGHNICGVLVHARPGRVDEAAAALSALPGVEVHQRSDDGRLVITVEDTDGRPAALTLASLPETSGVASTALIYHHCVTDDLSEEMPS